jgi:PBP1b-binding outer membrane lipoprotein LpoB
MKIIIIPLLALLLSGCSATVVSYEGNSKNTECPPVVSIHSFGSNVTVSDGSECRAKK